MNLIEQRDKSIEQVLAKFDFDKVHKAMVAVDWKWRCDDKLEIPARDMLISTARQLLENAWENEGTARTGGFVAWYDEEPDENGQNTIGLQFVFATYETGV